MTSPYRVSRAAVDLIKRFEGYRRLAAQAPDGGWTIGYGHTRTARAGAEVSERDAEALLLYDLIGVAHGVNEAVYTPLTQNQFDALCAFTFNVGLEAFRHSTVLRRINEGSLLQAASAMELWRKADFDGEPILVDALVRRRSAERALFLTPAGGAWVAAPSSVLRPRLDLDVDGLVPREAPVVVTTSFHGDRVTLVREAAPVRVIRPVEDAGPNPMQKAAESVTSRLQNFFRAPERRPAAVVEPVFELTHPEIEDETPAPAGRRQRLNVTAANEAAPGLFDTPLSVANDAAPVEAPAEAMVAAPVAERSIYHPAAKRPPEARAGLIVAVGVAGLILFLLGLYGLFNAGGPAANPVSRLGVTLAAGAGIVAMSVAAYLGFERFGRTFGDLGDE